MPRPPGIRPIVFVDEDGVALVNPQPARIRDSSAERLLVVDDAGNTLETFPASDHTHPQSEIVDLVTALAAKQPLDSDLTALAALTYVLTSTSFTPTITFATPGDVAATYTTQTGSYIRLGPLIFFNISLDFNPTHTTASGGFRVAGLPFTVATTMSVSLSNVGKVTAANLNAQAQAGGTQVAFNFLTSGAASTTAGTAQFPSGTTNITLRISGFYFT